MSTTRLHLRYRPAADVLSGRIGPPLADEATTVVEAIDADTTLVWTADGEDTDLAEMRLSSFQLVHAAARLEGAGLPTPAEFEPPMRSLIEATGLTMIDIDDPARRLRVVAEATADVPTAAVRHGERPDRPPGSNTADQWRVSQVSNSLARLADVVHHRAPAVDGPDAVNTEHFSRLLRELSTTIAHGFGRPAPGTSAATRKASRIGVALTEPELRALDAALVELDDTHRWHRASRSLDHLVDDLEQTDRCR